MKKEKKSVKFDRLKGAEWIKAYNNADRLTAIAMLSHALWVHKIASINYGYLSYLYSFKWLEYVELRNKVMEIKRKEKRGDA